MEEQMRELMDMLTGGRLTAGIEMDNQPHLSKQEAFSVIWYLQEHLHVLPDHFELCSRCLEIYDTETGGFTVDSSAEVDDWQLEIGVTREMLRNHDGACFCSPECEYTFWAQRTEQPSLT